jgi:Fe-S-cluster containining protein
LKFRCTECGECCRRFRVPLTGADVARLCAATGQPAEAFVEWLPPEAVDMTGEPGSFVRVAEGRRLLTLAHVAGRGCQFLDENRCTVHAHRPTTCRVYPFDVTFGKRAGIRSLRLLDMAGCEAAWDGANNPRSLVRDRQQEQRELAEYTAHVARFNRVQSHRQRLGKPLLTRQAFLQQLAAADTG